MEPDEQTEARRYPWPGTLAGGATGAGSALALLFLLNGGQLPTPTDHDHASIDGHPVMVERVKAMEVRMRRLERKVEVLCGHDAEAVAACRAVLP